MFIEVGDKLIELYASETFFDYEDRDKITKRGENNQIETIE
jgi:hypothetical protein